MSTRHFIIRPLILDIWTKMHKSKQSQFVVQTEFYIRKGSANEKGRGEFQPCSSSILTKILSLLKICHWSIVQLVSVVKKTSFNICVSTHYQGWLFT